MKKIFSKFIIGLLTTGFFLLPVSVSFRINYGNDVVVQVEEKIVFAAPATQAQKDAYRNAITTTLLLPEGDPGKPAAQAAVKEAYDVLKATDDGAALIPQILKEVRDSLGINWYYITTAKQVGAYPLKHGPYSKKDCDSESAKASDVLTQVSKDCYQDEDSSQSNVSTTGSGQIKDDDYSFKCDPTVFGMFGISLIGGSFGGCIAMLFYYVWVLFGQIMHLGGMFLDFFVYYSTNSDSYTGPFVEKGWAIVRDIANLFFIIALIYIAFKTILSDNNGNAKKTVGMIIMMALLINFSLFATKVVIDASNILAKIFYNNITSIDEHGKPIDNPDGERSISVGLVQKFNPQQVVSKTEYESNNGVYQFIFTAFILILITGYTAWIFFSVGLLFVARVISLWIAMIFSPIAFASQTMPSVNMGSIGFEKWLSELLRNAMLAPLFIFFLYLIVLFLDTTGSVITYTGSTGMFQNIMHVIIPFLILVGLLTKGKDLAVEYSGEMGKTVQTAGKMIAGAGGALVMGTTAIAGRKLVGSAMSAYKAGGSRVSTSGIGQWAQNTPIARGIRQLRTFNLVKRPTTKPGQEISENEKERKAQETDQRKRFRREGVLPSGQTRVVTTRTITGADSTQEDTSTEGNTSVAGRVNERWAKEDSKEARLKSVKEARETRLAKEATTAQESVAQSSREETKEKSELSMEENVKNPVSLETTMKAVPDMPGMVQTASGLFVPAGDDVSIGNIRKIAEGATPLTTEGQPVIDSSGEVARGIGAGGGSITINGPVTIMGGAKIEGGGGTKSEVEVKEGMTATPLTDSTEATATTEDAKALETSERSGNQISARAQRLISDLKTGKASADLNQNEENIPSARTLKDDVAEGKGISGWYAKKKYDMADKLSKSSFDLRNTKMMTLFSKHSGIDFGTAKGKGGYEKMAKDKKDRATAFVKELMPSGAEMAALNSLAEDKASLENEAEESAKRLGLQEENDIDAFKAAALRDNMKYQEIHDAYNTEASRINHKRFTRRNNYADYTARGGGSIIDSTLSHFGIYDQANLNASQYMRENVNEIEGREKPNLQTRQLAALMAEQMASTSGGGSPAVGEGKSKIP